MPFSGFEFLYRLWYSILCTLHPRFPPSLGAVTPVPSSEQKRCHEPKPILLNTVSYLEVPMGNETLLIPDTDNIPIIDKGAAHLPYEWAPNRVDVQMLRVGNFGEWSCWSPVLPCNKLIMFISRLA